ncbi:spondin-2-like [Scleropages formosus]|uniref:Spondin-2-like n=1 Tax=Scleropages formosus TaxID=113540 RepID=A0A0P7UNI4_SCLFO|nr:spondin-2-like [Scleropages formosus]
MAPQFFFPGSLRQLLVVLLKLTLSCAAPAKTTDGTLCTARGPASYVLVFTGHWSPQTFPKQYPLFRPPAQWSKLIAVTHNAQFRLWQEGAPASQGAQSFAEEGVTAEVVKEAREARKWRAVGSMYRTPGIPTGTGHSSTELLLQPRNPQVSTDPCRLSLMVKVIPSPDWFVGIDSLNLCEHNDWRQEVTLDLRPFDAGTDSGFTFSSPNFPTNPPENITQIFSHFLIPSVLLLQITSQNPNHPANSFFYPRLSELPPLATIRLTRQDRSPVRHNSLSNHIQPHDTTPKRFSGYFSWDPPGTGNSKPQLTCVLPSVMAQCAHSTETPLDCEVSLWSSWGLCLGSCSKGGMRHRTRYILLRPANSGIPCPELEEQAECRPRNCPEKH